MRTRTTGFPTSSNGASSTHLWWTPRRGAAVAVSAVLEVVEPPTVAHLYFWALQATFVDRRGRSVGAAHLGLQWHAGHPGGTAVNWGGYRSDGSGELDGDESGLPSATGNRNTRDFAWRPRTPYRLRITPAGRGEVTDVSSGVTTVVRRLHVPGAVALEHPVVWSEVFARCDDPPAAVQWSDLEPPPSATRVTYQSYEDGGCTNTVGGFVQRTGAAERGQYL
jgi:hypothetical protein